eukprot:752775-Hanusia_phi.AAC.2
MEQGECLSEPQELRLNQITVKKVTLTRWKEEQAKMRRNVICSIVWENREDEIEAGKLMQDVSVLCLNSEGKPISATKSIRTIKVSLLVQSPCGQSWKFDAEVKDGDGRTEGSRRFVFGPLIDREESVLQRAGKFAFTFSLLMARSKTDETLEEVAISRNEVEVRAGGVKSMKLVEEDMEGSRIQRGVPIADFSFLLLDAHGNETQNVSNEDHTFEHQLRGPDDSLRSCEQCCILLEGGRLVVRNLVLQDTPLGKWKFVLRLAVGGRKLAECSVLFDLIHGVPHVLDFTPNRQTASLRSYEMRGTSQERRWLISLLDDAGNPCSSSQGYVVLVSSCLLKPIRAQIVNGHATFGELELAQLRNPLFAGSGGEILSQESSKQAPRKKNGKKNGKKDAKKDAELSLTCFPGLGLLLGGALVVDT